MYNTGGYQLVDFTGVTINPDAAVTVSNSAMARIMKSTDKPVRICNANIGGFKVSAVENSVTDTGAVDSKVRYFSIQGVAYSVSTDDNTLTITKV